MKLVVDISEDTRKICRKICLHPVDFAIRDGEPLSDVLDEIGGVVFKACEHLEDKDGIVKIVLDILDKYKDGEEG